MHGTCWRSPSADGPILLSNRLADLPQYGWSVGGSGRYVSNTSRTIAQICEVSTDSVPPFTSPAYIAGPHHLADSVAVGPCAYFVGRVDELRIFDLES